MHAFTPVELNFLEAVAIKFINTDRNNQSFQKYILNKLRFTGLLLQIIQIMHSLDRRVKIHSSISTQHFDLRLSDKPE